MTCVQGVETLETAKAAIVGSSWANESKSNPVLTWSTQNHVKNYEGRDPQLFMLGIVPY